MNATWTRRDVLKTIAATAATPVLAHAAQPRRTVAIIGAGMAGVSVAWLTREPWSTPASGLSSARSFMFLAQVRYNLP